MKNNTIENYDLIGDIHGHADVLTRLLIQLGYSQNKDGLYTHPNRMPVFLGDFIDRGAEQAHVIDIVKPLLETGKALAVMGNHEFNAICYHSFDAGTGQPLREHSKKNFEQHKAFLKEYSLRDKKTDEVIEWFKTLPLFLELNDFRVIHACWNEQALKIIKPQLNPYNTLNDELLIKTSKPETEEFNAIETLLKGLEIPLPDGKGYHDNGGHWRTQIRVKWWAKEAATYRDYALVQADALNSISNDVLPESISSPEYPKDEKPVFIGHYWFSGEPEIVKHNVVCLDYSVANKEKLVCYQWNKGDTQLSNNNFVMVNADPG
jgi:hypothetical protein